MGAFQGKARRMFVRLLDDDSPVLGLTYEDVSARILKANSTEFIPVILDEELFEEIADGYYAVTWGESRTDVLGPFLYELEGVDFDKVSGQFDIEPNPITLLAAPPYCLVSGNIVDLTGAPPQSYQEIRFELAKRPSLSGSSVIAADLIVTKPDHFGNFSVSLIRGTKVILVLPQAGIKHTITIPDQDSANIIDILPPIG